MSWTQFPIRKETKDTHKRCVRIPSPAAGVAEKPTTLPMIIHLKWKISFIDERSRRNMYQWYIFLQFQGGLSVWFSPHMVQRRMEMRIDQSNIIFWLTILKITKNHKSLELGIVVKRVVLVFVILLLLCCCCSPVVQQGCSPLSTLLL